MIEAIAWGAVVGLLFLLVAGLRRLPWPHAGLLALGEGIVFAALRFAQLPSQWGGPIDAGTLVLLGAIGGGITMVGWERGERERARRSESIIGARPSSLQP